ncbi:hypothetical protein DYB37_001765 [Aphanomyces astaci]|uniref:Uncharacterized protein n=1 Tax=Aphanomyces astaci TaxID=112090 RepID=A0A3R7E909_APHAT|nr:hypothetical protein DYB35_001826 [Aphanomyces astaci]RHZ20012.1 hypothetical protein DYB37_001765 [Aphanomyces astaci]
MVHQLALLGVRGNVDSQVALGHVLNILRWLFVLGCPAIVFGYHILKVHTATLRSSEDEHKGDIDGQRTDDLEAMLHQEQILDVVYIDLGKLHTGHRTHGAYVININAQIYLETMHENVMPSLLIVIFVMSVATFIAAFNPISLASTSVEVSPWTCVSGAGQNCSSFSWTSTNDTAVVPTLSNLRPHQHYHVRFQHPQLPQVPNVLLLELHVDSSHGRSFLHDGGWLYQVNLSSIVSTSSTTSQDQPLVVRYVNKLTTTCSSTECGAIPLAAVYLQRFGASLSDVRSRHLDIQLAFLSHSSIPPLEQLPFRLVLTADQDSGAWATVTIRCLLGTFTAAYLVHFLVSLNAHMVRRDRPHDAISPQSLYFRLWGHLSLERHIMVLLLLVLAVHHNPLMLIPTTPWFGPPSHTYMVFRNVWETIMYVVLLGSVLVLLDCYRKDCRTFSNGASLDLDWLFLVKLALAAGVVVLRVSLSLSLEGLFDATVNVAQWVAVVDLLLLVAGFSVFCTVVAIVHRVLDAQRYSQTRYLSLSFRYLTVIAFAILAVLLLNTAFSSTYAPVSTTKSTDLTATPVLVEVATALFVYFAVLAFYPPNQVEPGLIPRGYVIRERRQYVHTPQELSPTAVASSSPPIPTTVAATLMPMSALSRTSTLLRRLPAFRAKASSKPHRLFCIETACLLMNCARHAYYRSSLNLPVDQDGGVVAYPATAYVNQTALVRDGLEESMVLHDDATDTNCLVLHSDCKIIFAFRGTDSKANVKTDLEIKLEPVSWLPRHSLGGALATLASIDLKLSFNRDMPLAFRLVNEGDIICGLPQRMTSTCFGQDKKFYKHIGTEVVMDGKVNGDFLIRPTFAEKNLVLLSSTTWVAAFVDIQGLDALQLFLPQPTSPMVEFNTTRGHATLQVVWHLCHFQSTLLCLTQADSRGSLVSLCLCLTVCVVPLKLQAVRILHLVAVASPQGKAAVVKALRELDAVTHVVHVVADLMHETTPVTLLEEVFRFVSTLLLLHQDDEEPWLRQVLTDSETCATLVDFHACREDAAMVQLHAAECRSLMQKAPSMVYTLHQLMARAKHAKTEHVLLQIAQTLIDLTSGDPATWQHVVAHLTTRQGVPSSADAARSPPPSSTSPPPSPRPPTLRTTELTTVEDHPKYAKYFKMLQVRVPEDLVRQRMIADSVDDRILDSPHLVVTAFDFEKAPQPSLPPPTPPPPLPLPLTTTHDGSDVVPAPNPQAEEEEHHVHGHGILSDIHCTQVLSVLASLPWPLAHLGHVIQSGDESILTSKFVDKLLVLLAIPSALEKKAIESILQGTHHSTCRDAERAVAVVLALAELIKCWQIYWQLPISLQEVRTKCTWTQDTCDEVIKSTDLFQV